MLLQECMKLLPNKLSLESVYVKQIRSIIGWT